MAKPDNKQGDKLDIRRRMNKASESIEKLSKALKELSKEQALIEEMIRRQEQPQADE